MKQTKEQKQIGAYLRLCDAEEEFNTTLKYRTDREDKLRQIRRSKEVLEKKIPGLKKKEHKEERSI